MLSRRFANLEEVADTTKDDLVVIPGIGEKTAESLAAWFADWTNRDEVEHLLASGLRPVSPGDERIPSPLKGLRVVITGTFSRLGRSQMSKLLEQRGAIVTSSVGAKTDALIVGTSPGSKLDKARQLGIRLIDEDEFHRLVESD